MKNCLLKYDKPAQQWENAMPLGNGHIGAMVHGLVNEEIISLNDDRLWSGIPRDKFNKNPAESFKKMQELCLDGDFIKAEEEFSKNFSGDICEAFMPLGDIVFNFDHDTDGLSNYERTLDISKGISHVKYDVDGVKYQFEHFISNKKDALFIKLTSTKKSIHGVITFLSDLKSQKFDVKNGIAIKGIAPTAVKPVVGYEENKIYYSTDKKEEGMSFCGMALIRSCDGTVEYSGGSLRIKDASYIELVYSSETNFEGEDVFPCDSTINCEEKVATKLQKLLSLDYNEVLLEHTAEHLNLFSRCELSLTNSESSDYTDSRIRKFNESNNDNGMYELLFNMGKYLMISSSRSGTMPSNMQGIWNNNVLAPWSCSYTNNINLQMMYWMVPTLGMFELQDSYDEFVSRLSKKGEKVAKHYYNARGTVSHHNVDIWQHCQPVGRNKRLSGADSFFPFGTAWLVKNMFDRYEYTQDEGYLKNTVLPILENCTLFFVDTMVKDTKNGKYYFTPGASPENRYYINGALCSFDKYTAMSQSIIYKLFKDYLFAVSLFDIQNEVSKKAKEIFENLEVISTIDDGRIQEFAGDVEEAYPTHRHISHLYALYPSDEISYTKHPQLIEGAKKTLQVRTDQGTGWSLAWKVCFWARLRDAKRCLHILQKGMRLTTTNSIPLRHSGGGIYESMFVAHPPFQIDANFGYVSGIVEMIVQNDGDTVVLLPALPEQWSNGSIKGVWARGGYKLNLAWENGIITMIECQSQTKKEITVQTGDSLKTFKVNPGEMVTLI